MTTPIRWGIIGTGNIASQFADGLGVLPDAQLVAVGSRTQASADVFGDKYQIPHRHATYQALVNDPDVDIVYVSTPHPRHKEDTLLCLEAGKPVLCEKPFTLNAQDTEAVIAVARQKKLFLMEAMWTRYLPAFAKLRELLAQGVLGEVRLLQVDFGFHAQVEPSHRLLDLALGGGALLDVGVYTVSLASLVFGQQPSDIASQVFFGATGADVLSATIFRYDNCQLASLSCGLLTNTPQDAIIIGANGVIRIHAPFWHSDGLTLSLHGQDDQVFSLPRHGNGYNYEAAEAMACLRAGKLESDVMPLDETISIMQTLDQIRNQWGLRYPAE